MPSSKPTIDANSFIVGMVHEDENHKKWVVEKTTSGKHRWTRWSTIERQLIQGPIFNEQRSKIVKKINKE